MTQQSEDTTELKMTSQAIPQNDKALLAAQAKAGQAGVDAYQAAKDEMASDQQQVLQHAQQAAQARGGPAQATQLATSQANDAYNKGQAQLSRGQANAAARSAGRQESMNLYNHMVLGSRSLIEDQAQAAALMINTQSEADLAGIRREGESTVNSINSQMELEAAQFEQAMREAEKNAQLEEERWEREMEQRERLARMSASGGGSGSGGRSATQAEIKAALAQGGIARLNEVAGTLGARVDQANITNEAVELLYTGAFEEQNKYGTAASQIFAPMLNNGMTERDIAAIAQGWADNGKIDETDLRGLAQYRYDLENPTPLWMQDPRNQSAYGSTQQVNPQDLDPFANDAQYEINALLAKIQNDASELINKGLESANSTGVQITRDDLDFGNLRNGLPGITQNVRNAGPGSNSLNLVQPGPSSPLTGAALEAANYRKWGAGNNDWLGDFKFDPVTGEQDRLNRELEYSTRDLYANDESMRPFLDAMYGQTRGLDAISDEQGISESRMIEQILGMRAPDEFNIDDYNPNANHEAIYNEFLRANPGMADGSGADVARQMFQEAMSSADPAYWDALNVSQEDLAPYMMMGRQELNDSNYLDASGTSQGKSLSQLYDPQSLNEMKRDQREIDAADNKFFNDNAQAGNRLEQLNPNVRDKYTREAAASNPQYYQMSPAGQAEAALDALSRDASQTAVDIAGVYGSDLEALFMSPEDMINTLNADFSDGSDDAMIQIGAKTDEPIKEYVGLESKVLDDLINRQDGSVVFDDSEGEDNLKYFTTLDSALRGLKGTIENDWNQNNNDPEDYETFIQELGLSSQRVGRLDQIMYEFMRFHLPSRTQTLSMNSNLPPFSGPGATYQPSGSN